MNVIISILAILIIIGGVAAVILTFVNEKKSVQKWLLLAVTEAEKQYGTKTGQLKLRAAYKSFKELFPTFSKYITFNTFSSWVDKALDQMKKMLESNKKAEEYVNGEKGD